MNVQQVVSQIVTVPRWRAGVSAHSVLPARDPVYADAPPGLDARLISAREALERCPCPAGCPSCVGPIETVAPKAPARALLARLVGSGG